MELCRRPERTLLRRPHKTQRPPHRRKMPKPLQRNPENPGNLMNQMNLMNQRNQRSLKPSGSFLKLRWAGIFHPLI